MPASDKSRMPIPPDGYAAAAIVLVVVLEWIAPMSLLPDRSFLSPLSFLGLSIAIGGLSLEIAAARELARSGTTTRPNGAPAALVTSGLFRHSRNPFYGGIIILLTGAFVGFSLDWLVLIVPAFWLALDRLVVPVEERRLETTFGDAWRAYAAATPRWLFR